MVPCGQARSSEVKRGQARARAAGASGQDKCRQHAACGEQDKCGQHAACGEQDKCGQHAACGEQDKCGQHAACGEQDKCGQHAACRRPGSERTRRSEADTRWSRAPSRTALAALTGPDGRAYGRDQRAGVTKACVFRVQNQWTQTHRPTKPLGLQGRGVGSKRKTF